MSNNYPPSNVDNYYGCRSCNHNDTSVTEPPPLDCCPPSPRTIDLNNTDSNDDDNNINIPKTPNPYSVLQDLTTHNDIDQFLHYIRDKNPVPVPVEHRYNGGNIYKRTDNAYIHSTNELPANGYNLMNENHWINLDTLVLIDWKPKAQFHVLVLPRQRIPTLDDLVNASGATIVQQLVKRANIIID
ncbi:hypothetical protein FBU30_007110, partial [Linnemannia zychae]